MTHFYTRLILVLMASICEAQSLALRWGSYFGGAGTQLSYHAVDRAGNVILAGHTPNTTLPTTAGAYQSSNKGMRDLFVAKFSPTGALLWATYYGGSQDEFLDRVNTDASGNIYLAGRTISSDFPRTTFVGIGGFVVVLDGSGARRWALAGGGFNEILDVAPDAQGNVVACGYAGDLGLPPDLLNLQKTYGGGPRDDFIVKIGQSGIPTFLSYLGGPGTDTVSSCVLDSRGTIHAALISNSSGFPGSALIGIDPQQGARTYTTPLGLGAEGYVYNMVLAGDSVWLTGKAESGLLVTANAATKVAPPGENAFVARVSTGGQLIYNSYVGWSGAEFALGVAADSTGSFLVCGITTSADLPVTPGALNARRGSGATDGFLNLYRADGSIAYSTYLTGTGVTFCNGVTLSGTSVVVSGLSGGAVSLVNGPVPSGAVNSFVLGMTLLPANAPVFSSAGVTNAASFVGGSVAPGEIVTVFAQGAGPAALAGLTLGADRRVTATAGGTRVFFDGTPAPMVYSVSGQVSAIVPYNVAGKSRVEVVVEHNSVSSAPVSVPVVPSAPGLFSLAGGVGQVVAVLEGGCCNSLTSPARR